MYFRFEAREDNYQFMHGDDNPSEKRSTCEFHAESIPEIKEQFTYFLRGMGFILQEPEEELMCRDDEIEEEEDDEKDDDDDECCVEERKCPACGYTQKEDDDTEVILLDDDDLEPDDI